MEIAPIVRRTGDAAFFERFSEKNAEKVRAFHASFPMYRETPLRPLSGLVNRLGIRGFYVKDESYRFGLNAFKVLGGSWAAARYVAKRLDIPLDELSFERIVSDEVRTRLGDVTFVTTTDGNHGRGVAWTARQLRQKAVVYMPKGTRPERLENIRKEGADASITEMSYDDAVRFTRRQAEANGWVMMQDTTLPGYSEIPGWIMEGYGTMAFEAYRQLPEPPTHIFVQAGVGSMAGAVAAFFASVYPQERKPVITVVEPLTADCVFQTAKAADGKLHAASGKLDTMMAGLACGEVCGLAWELLESCADFAIVCGDEASVEGMRLLASPVGDDPAVVSGESGAATTGLAAMLLANPSCDGIRRTLKLDGQSVILCFSTEGATDVENYCRVTGKKPFLN